MWEEIEDTETNGISIDEYLKLQKKIDWISRFLIPTGEGTLILFPILSLVKERPLIIYSVFAVHVICLFLLIWLTYLARNKPGRGRYQLNVSLYNSSDIVGYNRPLFKLRYLFSLIFILFSIQLWYHTICYLFGVDLEYMEWEFRQIGLPAWGVCNGFAVFSLRLVLQPEFHGYVFLTPIYSFRNLPDRLYVLG